MKYGMIGTCYNTGISHIAAGFAEHMGMKTLLVDYKPFAKFPERFPNSRITQEFNLFDASWLLEDIDVLFAIETPYRWDIFQLAHDKGIKVVFMPMIEWLDRSRPELKYVDLFICPSLETELTMHKAGYTNTVKVPCEVPVDLDKFSKRKITQARTFLHVSGHGGLLGRNGTKEIIEAWQFVKSDARLIVRSQYPLPSWNGDTRITYYEGNVQNYWDLYEEGDVWVMPWKYGVAVLGLQESMAAGMLPLITNMSPFHDYLHPDLLIQPASLTTRTIHAGQKELWAEQSPALIAESIDRLYNTKDIRPLLKRTAFLAKEWSWKVWKPKYEKIFAAL